MKKTLFLIPIATIVLAGCSVPFLSKTAEKVTQVAEEKVAQQEILKNCKYDKAICEYMAAQMSVFQSGMTMTSTTTTKGKASGEVSVTSMDGKGNMQSVSTKDGKETSAIVLMDKISYIKDYEDGKWMKLNSGEEKSEKPLVDIPTTAEAMKQAIESEEMKIVYSKVGQEACGSMAPGLTCDIYEMSERGQEEGKTKTWIDTSKHLSRKMEMNLSEGMLNTIVYAYGPVTIAVPSPVKEFTIPSFDVKGGQIPNQADLEKMMKDFPTEAPTDGE